MTDEIKSPCYGVCMLDDKQICVGCKRTQYEILEWRDSSNERKLEILENCKQRRAIRD